MVDKAQELESTQSAKAQAESSAPSVETAHSPAPDLSEAIAVTLSGRVRKTAQLFTFAQAKNDEVGEFTPPEGKGVKIHDVEFIKKNVEALGKQQHEMIRQLYSIMFGRRFQQKNVKIIKEHILAFSGIVDQDEKSREQLIAKMGKWNMAFVHDVMDLLAVDRSKKSFDEEGKVPNKEALLDRLVDWLYNPQQTKLAEKKAAILARKAKQKANKRAKAAKKNESESVKKKRKINKKKAVAVEENEDADHLEATESEGEESCSDFEDTKKKPAKKQKVSSRTTKSRIIESDNEDDVSEKGSDGSVEKENRPAAGKKEKPAAGKKERPATGKEEQPAATKDKKPAAKKKEKPAATKEEKPAATKKEKIAAGEEKKPAAMKEEKSVVRKEEKPTARKEEKLAAGKEEKQPATKSEDEANVVGKVKSESEVETLDADICSKIRDIIAHGNTEELTVKTIIRQLSADLGRDMSAQRNAIKEFITNDQTET